MVVLTLALGIGANTAIFSVVNGVLLEPIPYPDSGRLVNLCEMPNPGAYIPFASGGAFVDWQDHSTQLQSIAAAHAEDENLTGTGDAVRLHGLFVSAGYLGVYGIKPAMGRDFLPAEDTAGGNHDVAIISHELWEAKLGSDPGILGKPIHLGGMSYTVIGVLAPHALFNEDASFLVPSYIRGSEQRMNRDYNFVVTVAGRLKPGATAAGAAEELTRAKSATRSLYPVFKQKWTVGMLSMHEAMFGNFRPYVLTLLAAVGLVLLIACANVANLLLARSTVRQSEIAVRVALGATRARIVRQLLTESLVLALMGGVCGFALGEAALKPLVAFAGIPQLAAAAIGMSPRILIFTLAASCATGIVFGLLPALGAARPNLTDHLKEGMRGSTAGSKRKMQALLLVSETALTVLLLFCAGLLVRSFVNALNANTGFNPDNVLVFDLTIPDDKAPNNADKVRYEQRILDRIQHLPGVVRAGIASAAPMNGGNGLGDLVSREDRPQTRNDYSAGFDSVTGDFFQALQIPLLRGRYLNRHDDMESAPKVMVVNDTLAHTLFGNDDPIGKLLHFKGDVWQIVGEVGSVRRFQLDYGDSPALYFCRTYFPWRSCYVIRTAGPPLAMAPEIRAAIHEMDRDLPMANLGTLRRSVENTLQVRRTMLTLLGIFAGTALFLACVGIYGVVSYSVAQRTREVGIRIALGARGGQVIAMILRQGIRLVVFGLVTGLAACVGAGFLISSQLYDVSRFDPMVVSLVAAGLLGVALLASWLPARRAARVSPVEALRSD